MKLILVGRSGCGKTSVVESLLGSSAVSSNTYIHEVTRFSSPMTVAETFGFFSKAHDLQSCTAKLSQSVHSLGPGPDAFGLVIQIGRFTQQEKNIIDIFRESFGDDVFQFTILIFTRLDDLLYDKVTLNEFLEDSIPELKEILSLCSGRYLGFDNSGSWEARTGYAMSLVNLMKNMQIRNKSKVYTLEQLKKATTMKMKKAEDEMRRKEESHREMKENIKASVSKEFQDQIRKDIEEKLKKEDQEHKVVVHTFLEDKIQWDNQESRMPLKVPGQVDESPRVIGQKHSDVYRNRCEQKAGNNMKLMLIGRSGSGKTSVMESLIGPSVQPSSMSTTVDRFGVTLNIAETLGFFSKKHDIQVCNKSLADGVHAFHPGPDTFGLVIQIGRFTEEENKMVEIFRDAFGDDVFQFTILIFTRLDDLLFDKVTLDEFLADCTPELKEVLSLCDGRYLGFDNSGSWEERKAHAETLVSMIQTMQVKNNRVYTVKMLEKAKTMKKKKQQDKVTFDEERNTRRKEEMKTVMKEEMGEQIRKDIEVKLNKEGQKQRLVTKSVAEGKMHVKSATDNTTSPKNEKKKTKSNGPKPEIMPKPTHVKNKKNDKQSHAKPYTDKSQRPSSKSGTTPPARQRTGFIGRLINFWESLRS